MSRQRVRRHGDSGGWRPDLSQPEPALFKGDKPAYHGAGKCPDAPPAPRPPTSSRAPGETLPRNTGVTWAKSGVSDTKSILAPVVVRPQNTPRWVIGCRSQGAAPGGCTAFRWRQARNALQGVLLCRRPRPRPIHFACMLVGSLGLWLRLWLDHASKSRKRITLVEASPPLLPNEVLGRHRKRPNTTTPHAHAHGRPACQAHSGHRMTKRTRQCSVPRLESAE